MKSDELLRALNEVDDIYIEETAPKEEAFRRADAGSRQKRAPGAKRLHPWKIVLPAAAAGLLIAIYGVMRILPSRPAEGAGGRTELSESGTSPGGPKYVAGPDAGTQDSLLPMLTIGEGSDTAMGYEGYMAYSASELVNANPWTEELSLSTLPVWRNTMIYNESTLTPKGDFGIMRDVLIETAIRMGMDTTTLNIYDNAPSEDTKRKITEKFEGKVPEGYFDATALSLKWDGIGIQIDTSMTVEVRFDPAVSLPPEYDFTFYASHEDTEAVAEYLKETYRDLIGMKDPQTEISGGDYDIYNRQSYDIFFYEGAEDIAEQIMNYQFVRVAFYPDDDGNLSFARIYHTDLSDKTGDYPIISAEEAKKLLTEGHYITSVPFEMPGEEYVAKVDLTYRTGRREKYFMPYYRFYVELPEMEREGGMKDYGAYYVPAVEERYISNMPLWDGSFN